MDAQRKYFTLNFPLAFKDVEPAHLDKWYIHLHGVCTSLMFVWRILVALNPKLLYCSHFY